jgi:hypothetical protein
MMVLETPGIVTLTGEGQERVRSTVVSGGDQAAFRRHVSSRQTRKASARAARCSPAVMRCRCGWTWPWIKPCANKKRWPWPADVNRCIWRSRRLVGVLGPVVQRVDQNSRRRIPTNVFTARKGMRWITLCFNSPYSFRHVVIAATRGAGKGDSVESAKASSGTPPFRKQAAVE